MGSVFLITPKDFWATGKEKGRGHCRRDGAARRGFC